ncbi:thiamine pyrophosphate-binding protein [Clostridium sp. AM58-1XD]|uniref:thiamine pyrophosphate-binding protein n=1 Tax=Clostridium sp. AM58-1XD TaxID=2292307 RepID=UPI001FA85954|nr:thiamine pyrophosphate-binding protein [Clostridium sp. AM58-1XD]
MVIEQFFDSLKRNNVSFFTGVPDSYLNGFCNYLKLHYSVQDHVITANEGNAVALAAGYYLSTGKIPLVYMQNSGMGNSFNPLVSLADKHVYSIPMILLIGWRGEPGTEDAEREQHTMQGD